MFVAAEWSKLNEPHKDIPIVRRKPFKSAS